MERTHAIEKNLHALMMIPGLSGHEGRVRRYLRDQIQEIGLQTQTDRLGNLVTTLKGADKAPSVMIFAHMDQLGFITRKVDDDGFVRLERLGGVPERALLSQAVVFQIGEGRDHPGVIANKSHHATGPDEKYKVVPYQELYVDIGASSRQEAASLGIDVGTPVVYQPQFLRLTENRIAGTAVDDRAGCAVLIDVAQQLQDKDPRPTIHIVFSVQEEFNLRGVLPVVDQLKPDIAIQLDLLLTGDTPDMHDRTSVRLGAGPGLSLYSFHGRGTLNGTIPHPALPAWFQRAADSAGLSLQRSAQTGVLTETSYVQLANTGVACIDVGFPCRYTHSSLEVCDLRDLAGLSDLLVSALMAIDDQFSLDRDDYP